MMTETTKINSDREEDTWSRSCEDELRRIATWVDELLDYLLDSTNLQFEIGGLAQFFCINR